MGRGRGKTRVGGETLANARRDFEAGVRYASSDFGRGDPGLYGFKPPTPDSLRLEVANAVRQSINPYTGGRNFAAARSAAQKVLSEAAYRAGLARGLGMRGPSLAELLRAAQRGARDAGYKG